MTFLHRYSIRHPTRVLLIAALVVLAIAPGALRLELRTDGYALVPAKHPDVIFDRAVREEFNNEDPIVVVINSDHPEGIYNASTLQLVQRLTREFQDLEAVQPHNVSSLETEHGHRVKQGSLTVRRLLQPLPVTAQARATLRNDLDRIELYTGTIVSPDGTATCILVGVPSDVDRTELYGKVQDIIAARGPRPEQIRVIGAPVAESLLGIHLLEDLGVPRALLGVRTSQNSENGGVGWPPSLYELRVLIGRHIGLVPIAILIMAIVFAVSFRSLTAAALPLIEVGACLAAVFGLMGWFGVPIYLTIAVMPVILTAIGVADEIHVFARYRQELRARPEGVHLDALVTTMDEMWVPVVKTSVTTAVGFLFFVMSPLGPVRAFGIFTSVGIIFCMLWSLSVVPAMLALIHPSWFVARSAPTSHRLKTGATLRLETGATPRLKTGATRRFWPGRYAVIAVAVIVLAATPFGLDKLTVQDSWIDGFAPDSEFYRATRTLNEQFLGSHILLVRIQTNHHTYSGEVPATDIDHHQIRLPADLVDHPEELVGTRVTLRRTREAPADALVSPRHQRRREWKAWIAGANVDGEHLLLTTDRRRGSPLVSLRPAPDEMIRYEIKVEPLIDPEVINRIGELEAFIETQRERTVGGVLGTASYLSTANFMARGLSEGTRVIPDDRERILWVWSQYKRIRGPERLRQVVDPDYAASLVTVFLKNANFVDVKALMTAIREYEREHLEPHGITLGFAGDVAVSQTLIEAIVQTQVWSLLGSLLGILLITSLMGRSLRWGLLCVLPCALAVLVNFAVMGWTGMPLGVATSMFAGMTLGIGVDFAIHLLERYRLARSRGLDPNQAVSDALTMTGPAIVIDAVAVALGFGILTLSQVPANARLGALVVLSIVSCLAATLLLLPALLSVGRPVDDPPQSR